MRALIFASVLGSAMSAIQIPDQSFMGVCPAYYPLPGGLIPENPENIDSYFVNHPITLKGSEDICEGYEVCPINTWRNCAWEDNECKYTGAGTETTSKPCSSFKSPDFDFCPQLINPSQAMVVGNNLEDTVVSYRASLDHVRHYFEEFIPQLTYFSSQTGVYSEHAIIVKEYTDYMRQLAAYADAVATGTVKSPMQLGSVGGGHECANDPDASGISLNIDVFNEWKLGPFDTAPEVGVNAGNCSALETAYRSNCGCDPA